MPNEELDNMKRLSDVKIQSISIVSEDQVIFTIRYAVIAGDGTIMYQTNFTRDMTNIPNIGSYTIAQMRAWAKSEAVKDAKVKWGK